MKELPTVEGSTIPVKVDGKKVMLGDAEVIGRRGGLQRRGPRDRHRPDPRQVTASGGADGNRPDQAHPRPVSSRAGSSAWDPHPAFHARPCYNRHPPNPRTGGRAAEGTGLLNRRTVCSVPRVRIPPCPLATRGSLPPNGPRAAPGRTTTTASAARGRPRPWQASTEAGVVGGTGQDPAWGLASSRERSSRPIARWQASMPSSRALRPRTSSTGRPDPAPRAGPRPGRSI